MRLIVARAADSMRRVCRPTKLQREREAAIYRQRTSLAKLGGGQSLFSEGKSIEASVSRGVGKYTDVTLELM